jgi:hypothetical protein
VIIVNFGYNETIHSHAVILYMAEYNLSKLVRHNNHMHVASESFGITNCPGLDLLVFANEDAAAIPRRGVDILRDFVRDDLRDRGKVELRGMRLCEAGYVFPYRRSDERQVQVLGLDRRGLANIRRIGLPTFSCGAGLPLGCPKHEPVAISISMRWGSDDEAIEEMLGRAGHYRIPNVKITRQD